MELGGMELGGMVRAGMVLGLVAAVPAAQASTTVEVSGRPLPLGVTGVGQGALGSATPDGFETPLRLMNLSGRVTAGPRDGGVFLGVVAGTPLQPLALGVMGVRWQTPLQSELLMELDLALELGAHLAQGLAAGGAWGLAIRPEAAARGLFSRPWIETRLRVLGLQALEGAPPNMAYVDRVLVVGLRVGDTRSLGLGLSLGAQRFPGAESSSGGPTVGAVPSLGLKVAWSSP